MPGGGCALPGLQRLSYARWRFAYHFCSPGKRSATGENRQGRITRRVAPRPSGRCLRQRFLATLESNLGRSFSSFPALEKHGALCLWRVLKDLEVMVVGEGFEPSKSMTADLQSAPFGRSGTPPRGNAFYWPASCWKRGASYQMRRPCKAFL